MSTLMGTLCGQGPSIRLEFVAKKMEPFPVVVDLSQLNRNSAGRSRVVEDIGKACRKLGCFQVINHGIDTSVMKGAVEAASGFFEMPKEEKEVFASDDITNPVRYETISGYGISEARAFLKHYAHPLSDWVQFWPLEPQGYREKMGQYAIESRRLTIQLMDAILESLGLGQGYLKEKLEEGIQLLAINSYPKSSQPGDLVRLAPHNDYGFLTILLQTCQGLEVMESNGEAWRAVPQVPDTLHVLTGDYLEVLSNGVYNSVVHRAVPNTKKQRISIASIQSLSMSEKVGVAQELLDEQRPKKYKESSFRDFLNYLSTKASREKRFIESLKLGEASQL